MEIYKELKTSASKEFEKLLNSQLSKTQFLVGNEMTIADISLYAYSHVADEGGFDLSRYPAIQHWCQRIQATPGYVGKA